MMNRVLFPGDTVSRGGEDFFFKGTIEAGVREKGGSVWRLKLFDGRDRMRPGNQCSLFEANQERYMRV